jgi:hypothetical protein
MLFPQLCYGPFIVFNIGFLMFVGDKIPLWVPLSHSITISSHYGSHLPTQSLSNPTKGPTQPLHERGAHQTMTDPHDNLIKMEGGIR